MKYMKKTLLILCLLMVSMTFNAQNLLTEGFDVFANLTAAGWISTNQSSPLGASTWAQGGGTAFSGGGQAGGTTSFALCNYNSTTGGTGTISNWLITPVLTLQNGDVISFYTRKGGTGTGTIYPDRLEVRLNSTDTSTSGNPSGATGVGAFTTLAVSVNPNLTTTDYPFTWTQYSYTVTGLTGEVSCRIGFRYYVTNGGPSGTNSDIIAIDTFSVDRPLSSEDFFKKNFSLYPNPAGDIINITVKDNVAVNSLSISDINGRVVSALSGSSFLNSINVSDLPPGVYFVSLQTDEGKGTSRFIKN
jgi:hypothetical protein